VQRALRRLAAAAGVLGAAAAAAVGLPACGSGVHQSSPNASTARGSAATARAVRYVEPPAGIAAVQLFEPIGSYTGYVEAKLSRLRGQLSTLDAAIDDGHLGAARRDWLSAHLTWLQIGQDDGAYGAFGNLGSAIDGTAAGRLGGTASARFTGFHKVELDLFRRAAISTARADAARLTSLVASITPTVVNSDLPLNFAGLDAWVLRAHEILEDGLRDSLSQDDNYGADNDLASIDADVSATREMLSVLKGLIAPRSPGLVSTATRRLDQLNSAIAAAPAGREPSGLALRTRQRIDAAVGAALETLAPISELMQISNANS
jgi:high-affinity iron transporter